MTSTKTLESFSDRNEDDGEWLQVTPGERFRIRIPSVQTMGAYTVIEVVADPHNGVPLHIHNREEEHFIVLDGTLDIAIGDRRWTRPPAQAQQSGGACLMPGATPRICRCICW